MSLPEAIKKLKIGKDALINRIKDLEADLLIASTRDTAQLELIGKLEAENKRLRDAGSKIPCTCHNSCPRCDWFDDALLKDK